MLRSLAPGAVAKLRLVRCKSAARRMSQLPILLIPLLWLNSLVSQLLLARSGQPVSFIAFICWTPVYAGICFGLWRRVRLAYWCAVVLSILQLLPAVLW